MIEWLVGLPVWLQTPLFVLVVTALCAAIAVAMRAVVWWIVPPTQEEARVLGTHRDFVNRPGGSTLESTRDNDNDGSQGQESQAVGG